MDPNLVKKGVKPVVWVQSEATSTYQNIIGKQEAAFAHMYSVWYLQKQGLQRF
jgi:hypothetical protein